MMYYKKYRPKTIMCTQSNVATKNALLKLRIEEQLKDRIMELSNSNGKSASEMTRILWVNYFKRSDAIEWKKEVCEWRK